LAYIREFFTWIVDKLFDLTNLIGFPSYALAIILIAIIIKILLYPMSLKQMKSTLGMQEIQPKMQELQKKYKNDPDKLNKAMSALYKEHDVKPTAGCLPLLIQMPILIGLYQAMRYYEFTNLDYAGFFWIPNLAESDPYYILPIIVAISMFLQQKITMVGMEDNPTMKMMLYVMPLMIGWMSISFPSGLCLYWAIFSLMGIIQQFFLNRKRKAELAVRAEKAEAERLERERIKEEQRLRGQAPSKRKVDKAKRTKPRAEYIKKAPAAESAEESKEN